MKKKTTTQATPKRKATKPSPKARKPSQLDRIEAELKRNASDHGGMWGELTINTGKLDTILASLSRPPVEQAAPQPEGLQPGDYTDASKETADALTAMGWEWRDNDRHTLSNIVFLYGAMINCDGAAHPSRHLTPAEFLSRAAVTAKALGLVPVVEEEEWVPKVNDWITADGSALFKMRGVNGPDDWSLEYDGKLHTRNTNVKQYRPATDAEVQQHFAEQEARANAEKVAKLKWGVRVKTQKGREYRIACDKPNEDGLYRVAPDVAYTYDAPMLSVDEFTVIEQP